MTDEQHEEFIAGLGGFGNLAGLGALDGKLLKRVKKATKKVGQGVKKVAKKTATATKKAVKKTGAVVKKTTKAVGKGIKKATKATGKFVKKVVKAVVRFNPISLLAKGGVLICIRLNMFKMAEKLYPAIISNQEALNMGFTVFSNVYFIWYQLTRVVL